MHTKLAILNHCAVPFLSRAAVNLYWYYYASADCSKLLTKDIFNYSEVKNIISVNNNVTNQYIHLNCMTIYGHWSIYMDFGRQASKEQALFTCKRYPLSVDSHQVDHLLRFRQLRYRMHHRYLMIGI